MIVKLFDVHDGAVGISRQSVRHQFRPPFQMMFDGQHRHWIDVNCNDRSCIHVNLDCPEILVWCAYEIGEGHEMPDVLKEPDGFIGAAAIVKPTSLDLGSGSGMKGLARKGSIESALKWSMHHVISRPNVA